MFRRHPVVSTLTCVYNVFVLWVTLTPRALHQRSEFIFDLVMALRHVPRLHWMDYDTVEFFANIAMFAPVGVFFVLLFGRNRWWLALAVGVVMTSGIEFAQRWIPGRVSDPRDILANSLGTLLGVLAVLIATAHRRRRRRAASVAYARPGVHAVHER